MRSELLKTFIIAEPALVETFPDKLSQVQQQLAEQGHNSHRRAKLGTETALQTRQFGELALMASGVDLDRQLLEGDAIVVSQFRQSWELATDISFRGRWHLIPHVVFILQPDEAQVECRVYGHRRIF